MVKSRLLITGATGFLGGELFHALSETVSFEVVGSCRSAQDDGQHFIPVGELNALTDWSNALSGKEVVIHCAAAAHQKFTAANATELYEVNVNGALNLLKQAILADVKQFIFISSIRVNGSQTVSPFFSGSPINPKGEYTKSKAMAEKELTKLADRSGIELTIIRLPLVYGRGVRGNFALLMKALPTRIPLPLANIKNRRSMVSIYNLINLIETCILNKKAYGKIFLISDGDDVSTTTFLQKMGESAGVRVRLFWFPRVIIKWLLTLIGKKEAYQGLFGTLQVDITETCQTLDWTPPFSLEEGLSRCFIEKEK